MRSSHRLRHLRTLVVCVGLLGLVSISSSCRSTATADRFEIETYEYEIESHGGVDVGGGFEGERLYTRLRARQIVWVRPGRMAVHSYVTLPPAAGADDERPTYVRTRTVYDLETGDVWRAERSGLLRRQSAREREHRVADERRRASLDELDILVRDAEYAASDEPPFFCGDGVVEVVPSSTRGFVSAHVALEPGIAWFVSGAAESVETPRWKREALWVALLGGTRNDARQLARAIDAMPLRARGVVLTDAGEAGRRYLEFSHRIVERQRGAADETVFEVPGDDVTAPPAGFAVGGSAEAILAALRRPAERPAGVTALGLVLAFEVAAQRGDLPSLAGLWRETADTSLQVELMRVGLRRWPDATRALLDADRSGTSGTLALSAIEALLLEDDDSSRAALFALLARRDRYDGTLDHDGLFVWAVRWLRLVGGLDRDELVRDIGPLWRAPAEGAPTPTPHEALAREVEFWFDRRRASGGR